MYRDYHKSVTVIVRDIAAIIVRDMTNVLVFVRYTCCTRTFLYSIIRMWRILLGLHTFTCTPMDLSAK